MSATAKPIFDIARLRRELKPFKLYYFSRLRSTNDHATELRRRGKLFAPALVLTGKQIAGRGRGSNSWWSDAGSITVTFVFPVEEHLSPHQVPLLAGLAVRDAAAELCGDEAVLLKWPNDVVFKGRKLAGLLCERVSKADLIGVGLNVNTQIRRAPAALREQITSLAIIGKNKLDMTDALTTVARRLHGAMSRRGDRLFIETLHRYDKHYARRQDRQRRRSRQRRIDYRKMHRSRFERTTGFEAGEEITRSYCRASADALIFLVRRAPRSGWNFVVRTGEACPCHW